MEWNGMEWNGMEWNGMYGGHHPWDRQAKICVEELSTAWPIIGSAALIHFSKTEPLVGPTPNVIHLRRWMPSCCLHLPQRWYHTPHSIRWDPICHPPWEYFLSWGRVPTHSQVSCCWLHSSAHWKWPWDHGMEWGSSMGPQMFTRKKT